VFEIHAVLYGHLKTPSLIELKITVCFILVAGKQDIHLHWNLCAFPSLDPAATTLSCRKMYWEDSTYLLFKKIM
jgi:hypothetical protein